MRELKFRAWDKEAHKMRTDFVLAPTSPDWGAFPIQHSTELEKIQEILHKAFALDPELRQKVDPDGYILSYTTSDYTYTDWANYYGLMHFEVMQFTGLKDATKWEDLSEEERAEWTRAGNMPSEWNGKEIYEGDILSEEGIGMCGVATWDEKLARYIKSNKGIRDDWMWDENRINDKNILKRGLEVIGNVWENPDLVEVGE